MVVGLLLSPVVDGRSAYPTVELLGADPATEGVVTTESHRERRFSGMVDLLWIVEDLQPPADPSVDEVSPVGDVTPRWPR